VAEAGSQEIWPALHGERGAAGALGEGVKIDGGIVGQRIGLEPGPQIFDGIEFGSVRRQVLQDRKSVV
jgi:hypothetical protein